MNIPEACQHKFQEPVVGLTGKTLVLDMGEPVKFADEARTPIEQAGKDVEMVHTGLRKNEQLDEELFDSCESPLGRGSHESIAEVRVEPLWIHAEAAEGMTDYFPAEQWLNAEGYAAHRAMPSAAECIETTNEDSKYEPKGVPQ